MTRKKTNNLTYILIGIPILYVIYQAQQALLLVLFATILAIGFAGLIFYISKKAHISNHISFLLLLMATTLFIGVFSWYIAPQLETQVRNFSSSVANADFGKITHYIPIISMEDGEVITTIQNNISRILSEVSTVFSRTLTTMTFLIVTLFIVFRGTWNSTRYINVRKKLMKTWMGSYDKEIDISTNILQKWLLARSLSMIAVGILTYIGLLILGVPTPLFLAMIASIFSFVPNIGPILSVIPAIVMVASSGLELIGLVILLYIGIQFIEGYFITPGIQQELIQIPPAVLFAVQLIAGTVFGILGLLLAAPLTAVAIALINNRLS
jgi:predicted PurR-regulated permease PerM